MNFYTLTFVYKRVSDSQKILILESFKEGLKIKELSEIHKISIPTITRQIKKLIGEDEFKKIKNKFSSRVASKKNYKSDNKLINKTESICQVDTCMKRSYKGNMRMVRKENAHLFDVTNS